MSLTRSALVWDCCHFASVKSGGFRLSSPLPSSRWHLAQCFVYRAAVPPPALLPLAGWAVDSSQVNETRTATAIITIPRVSGFLIGVFILLGKRGTRWHLVPRIFIVSPASSANS